MISTWLIFIGSFLVTFLEAFVKAFQSRNIAQGRVWAAGGTSLLVTFTIFATFGVFTQVGWHAFIPAALGGAIGTILSIKTHKYLYRSKS